MKPPPKKEPPLMNGREAVRYFARCKHTGEIKSIHFNLAPSRHFAPYKLISVAEDKVNPEHFVFSSFGVLHVYPDQPSESLTLAEWQKQAVLWKAVSAIPFFKNYLKLKMFRRQKKVSERLLSNVPAFGAALLQISRLLKELLTVQFLPFETDMTYQLGEYENNINYKNIQAEKILVKFFRYCKLVVDTTAEECMKRTRYCEEQVKKKTFFSKDSLHLQKIKQDERWNNLQIANKATR
nr:hypothetical protein BaRGS_029266 [Batillaria attramentaria]